MSEKYQIGFTPETPHTFPYAKPIDYDKVKKRRVIHIKQAYYRGSTLNGTFELVEQIDIPFIPSIKGDRVKVIFYWFGCRPRTSWPKILIEHSQIEIEENFSGKVVRNVGI